MAIIDILSVVVFSSMTASLDDADPARLPEQVEVVADEFQQLCEGEGTGEGEGEIEGAGEGVEEGETEGQREGEGAAEREGELKSPSSPKIGGSGLIADQGDGVPDVVQMFWILAIDHGDTQLDSFQRNLVSGTHNGYGQILSLLTGPVFLEGLYNQIIILGAPPDQATDIAADLAEFLALLLTVDPVYYGQLFENTFIEGLLADVGGIEALSGSAMGVIGGQADPDHDGRTNAQEWLQILGENYSDQERVAAFTTSAESGDPSVPALSHIGLIAAIMAITVCMLFIHQVTGRKLHRMR